MNRLIALIASAVLAVFMFAGGLVQPAASAHAAPFNSLIQYRVTPSSTSPGRLVEMAYPEGAGLTRPPRAAAAGRQCEAMSAQAVAGTAGGGGAMVPATLASLTHASEAVVVGTVIGFRGCLDADTNSIVTEITLAAERGVKAPVAVVPGTELTFDVPGGRYGGYLLAVGTSPEFAAGERVAVFLRRTVGGSLRLTEDHQGKFTVTPAGTIARIGMPLDAFAAKVEQAENGTLPASEDPLAPGPIGAEQSAFLTYASWAAVDIPVSYFINSSASRPAQLSAAQTENAFNNAFDTWENDPGSTIAFTFAGNTTRLSGADGCPGYDGNNDLTWGIPDLGHSAGTLAITYACYNVITLKLVDADIEFDTDHFGADWRVDGSGACATGLFDLETVALHEEGHFIGLLHSSANSCTFNTNGNCPVMNALYGGVQRSLCQDDRDGAAALYPPPAVGGVAEVPDVSALASAQGGSSGNDALLYGGGAAVLALAAVGLWARRRHTARA